MKVFLSLLLLLIAIKAGQAGTCNSYDREKVNEDYKPCVYRDSRNIPTIGVGFNLLKSGAKSEIESVGANYNAVLNGSQCLNDHQIETLFNEDMATAISCASSWLGSSWYSIGSDPQSAIADMAFNMGCGSLHGFVNVRTALSQSPPDYEAARESMKDSAWCGQVGDRCGRDLDCMS